MADMMDDDDDDYTPLSRPTRAHFDVPSNLRFTPSSNGHGSSADNKGLAPTSPPRFETSLEAFSSPSTKANSGAAASVANRLSRLAVEPARTDRQLDLLFIMDATGSMGSYIDAATTNIEQICDYIVTSERLGSPENLHVGMIAYRDHPPQDNSWVTKVFPFTTDVAVIKAALHDLYASGGGDGPEAVAAAMSEALEFTWRPGSAKMCVLITDAPPHGIGEYGDGFPAGIGTDPLQLARSFASRGITLFMIACEPGLSHYNYAVDFYKALAALTSGIMIPLFSASVLAEAIVAAAAERLDMERLIAEVGDAVRTRISETYESRSLVSGGESDLQASIDHVAQELHSRLSLRGEVTRQMKFETIYRDTEDVRWNEKVWSEAQTMEQARPELRKITGTRFTDAYLHRRYGTSFTSAWDRAPPPPPPAYSVTSHLSTSSYPPPVTPASSPSGLAPSPLAGLSRKPLQSFTPFSAQSKQSIGGGGLALAAEGAGSEAAAAASSAGVAIEQNGISMEQAKRIAQSSIWRSRV